MLRRKLITSLPRFGQGKMAVLMGRSLLTAIPTRQVASSFACDALVFWVVAYWRNEIEPAWLIPVMQCMLMVDMLLTVIRAYKRQVDHL